MNPTPRMRNIFINILCVSALFGRDPSVFVYVLPFDNIQNDPTVEWIAPGLSDMVIQELNTLYGVKVKNKDDLETVMNDRSMMLKQPRGSKNILVLGKFNRQLDNILVSIQMVDISNWDELAKETISDTYSQVSSLNTKVGATVKNMLNPHLFQAPVAKTSPYPSFSEPKPIQKRHPISVQSEQVVSKLDKQIEELEASMDILLGARERDKTQTKQVEPTFTSGEWSMDFDVDRKLEDNPKNAENTSMLATVLDQLLTNPYDVELQRPEFEYHEDDENYMTIRFPVVYKLKDKIIKDMLTTLPYTGLEQNGSLTVFYFDRESFNFPQKQVQTIKDGSYRRVPVLRIFDENRNTLIVVADTPEKYWHSKSSNKVLYVPQHQFSQLIDFTVGGWSLQVAMETVEIHAVYEFILPVSEMESLSNVSLKFVNEVELKTFLDPLL